MNEVINSIYKIGINILFLLVTVNVSAVEITIEFSADAIQVSPGRAPLSSKMYVSTSAVRTDMIQNGLHIIDIAYPQKGKRVVLYPEKNLYIEQTGLPTLKSWSSKSAKTPCEGIKNAKCKKLSTETLNKVKVEKWQVEQTIAGKKYRSLHWIDSKRRIAIKELFHDGGVAELKMLGEDKINNRKTEKWEYQYSNPAGQQRVSRQWYDTQLKMVIREEMPGGFLRELKNIKIEKQKKSLFNIPKGYKKIKNTAAGNNAKNNNRINAQINNGTIQKR